jgi:type I restriction enzyme S subunit
MSEWRKATLGEVVRLDVQTADVIAESLYPIVGVLNRGRGLLVREPLRGIDTAYKTLNKVRPGQIVYSRLKAFEGAITVVPKIAGAAYASQEFPTFTCGADLMPEFFRLLTTTPQLWDTLQNLSTGMGGRRERVKPAAFLGIPVALPPLSEQRRIVAVISAVDAQIEALTGEHARASAARLAFESEACAALAGFRLLN